MHELFPSYYFDLSTYKHRSLFDEKSYVWESLKAIDPYLKDYPLGKIETPIPSTAYLVDPALISIGTGTVVEPGAYIKGPCIIGENCTIRHGAYIRGLVITGDRCVIGHATEIKQSILLDDAHAAHFAYVGDCILGNHINLGAGTKCANLRLDNGNIVIHIKGQHFPTGLRKMGMILGDHSQTGCNSVSNPGTLAGKEIICYPCTSISGFIPSHKVVHFETVSLLN